jgi:hypothetical protein
LFTFMTLPLFIRGILTVRNVSKKFLCFQTLAYTSCNHCLPSALWHLCSYLEVCELFLCASTNCLVNVWSHLSQLIFLLDSLCDFLCLFRKLHEHTFCYIPGMNTFQILLSSFEDLPSQLLYVQGVSKKSGIIKFLTFCVIPLGLLSSEENNSCLHKIEFIVFVFSIIDFLSFKRCLRYYYDFLLN